VAIEISPHPFLALYNVSFHRSRWQYETFLTCDSVFEIETMTVLRPSPDLIRLYARFSSQFQQNAFFRPRSLWLNMSFRPWLTVSADAAAREDVTSNRAFFSRVTSALHIASSEPSMEHIPRCYVTSLNPTTAK
jgi:hypothetical protein